MTRGLTATALVAVSLLVLSGCATAPTTEPVETPEPTPTVEAPAQASRPAIEVPITSGSLENQPQFPTEPVNVSVPSLDITMSVTDVGVDDANLMEIPEDVDVAGWYRYGPGPDSDEGTTVIAAHVDFPNQGVGPFSRLRDAQVGSDVTITDADGVVHTYRVTGVERIPKAEVPLEQVFAKDGPQLLKLVTCGGSFDRNAGSYSDNYIVTAEKVS